MTPTRVRTTKGVSLVSTRHLPFTTSVPVLPTEDVQSESPGMLPRRKRVTLRTGGHHPTATHTRSQRSWSKLAALMNKLFDIKAIFGLVYPTITVFMLGINIAFKTPKNKFQELIYQFQMFSTHSNARFENKKSLCCKTTCVCDFFSVF